MACNNSLSLPIDVPWKRLCVSKDMMDQEVCDREFPYRWRSSVTVFSYEPPDDQQLYDDMIVTYLKAVFTITGFNAGNVEIGLTDRRLDSYWNDPVLIENINYFVKYYGCHGAILEIGVAPSGKNEDGEDFSLNDYPYFMDFEPKKREIYELVSETGETMSRSLEDVNVRKGMTTSESHEVYDQHTFGGKGSLSGSGEGITGGITLQGSQEKGTKDVNQKQYEDVRSTDRARELRETYSHTTQLTQMYHQFTSYHLGTNRAVFFVLPRPHILQPKDEDGNPNYTFVNGPRELEGIQEVFLVVMRPKKIKQICVEAYLETAHLFKNPKYDYETGVGHLLLEFEGHTETHDVGVGKSVTTYDEKSETYFPPIGWEIDIDNNTGFDVIENVGYQVVDDYPKYEIDKNHMTIWARVKSVYTNKPGKDNVHKVGWIKYGVNVHIRSKTPKVVGSTDKLFLTGRGVCCCPPEEKPPKKPETPDSITWEGYPVDPYPVPASTEPGQGMSILQANKMRANIGREMIRSVNRPDRYPRGRVSFTEAQFVADSVAELIRREEGHPDDQPVAEIKGLDPYIRDKVLKVNPTASRGWLLEHPLQAVRDIYGLTHEESVKLRRALLGLEGPLPEPRRRWDPPGSKIGVELEVPNVVHMSLVEAQKVLNEAHFAVGEISYRDSEQPHNTVLEQEPAAGSKSSGGFPVDLWLATGLTVKLPDVLGKSLTEALCLLREAGLECDPDLRFVESQEQPKHHIIEMTPEAGLYVTPCAEVTLYISSGSDQPRDEKITVPGVVNKSLSEARRAIQEAYLKVGDVAYQDSDGTKDTVLNQYPDAGTMVERGTEVDLVVATGVTVRIPDIVGKSLQQALNLLSEAGLESEPEIISAPSDQPRNCILEVTPDAGTYVTPNADVVLQVSSGPKKGKQTGI